MQLVSRTDASRYPRDIQPEPQSHPLPAFDRDALEPPERYPYGARSEAAVFIGDLLCAEVPSLADGDLEIVAIARRPGVLSKVAIRPRLALRPPRGAGIGADQVARVRERLDGERIDVVMWQSLARPYIAHALGLGVRPMSQKPSRRAAELRSIDTSMLILPGIRHARVLLGEIDLRGIAGWRGLNVILASALTGWRIRLVPVAATVAWCRLHAAMLARRPVLGTVVGSGERGLRVEVLGLYAVLPTQGVDLRADLEGQDIQVRVTRMDADEGRVFVSRRLTATGQLALPLQLKDGQVAAVARSSNTFRG